MYTYFDHRVNCESSTLTRSPSVSSPSDYDTAPDYMEALETAPEPRSDRVAACLISNETIAL